MCWQHSVLYLLLGVNSVHGYLFISWVFCVSPANQEEENILGLGLGLEVCPALNSTSVDPVTSNV